MGELNNRPLDFYRFQNARFRSRDEHISQNYIADYIPCKCKEYLIQAGPVLTQINANKLDDQVKEDHRKLFAQGHRRHREGAPNSRIDRGSVERHAHSAVAEIRSAVEHKWATQCFGAAMPGHGS